VAITVVTGILSACEPPVTPDPPPAPPPRTYQLTGTVRESPSVVIPNATVTVVDGPNSGLSTTTNNAGTYTLSGLAFAAFSAAASASGYVSSQRPMALNDTTQATVADFTLTRVPPVPAFTLFGVVTDTQNHRPIVGALVIVVTGPNANKSSSTNGDGYYSIAGMVASTFTLRTTYNNVTLEERTVSMTGETRLDFVAPPPPPPPPPPPGGGGNTGGNTASVNFVTNSLTCSCTAGGSSASISLKVDNATVGTMTCTQSRTVAVSPGTHTINACDSGGCWGDDRVTLRTGDVERYTLTCSSTARDKQRRPF
jgi:hypothetical protein